MVKRLILLTLVLLSLVALSYSTSASLVPMSWGFPVLIQNSSLTGLTGATQSASDLESSNIAFPTAGLGGGIFGSAFPTIGQNSLQNALATNFGYMNQQQSTYFAYPFISIGGSPVPSMGLL